MITIPEISPLFLLSMCGLSLVCTGGFLVVFLLLFRVLAGDTWEMLTGAFGGFGGVDKPETPAMTSQRAVSRRDLRARAQSYDFDQAITSQSATSAQNPAPTQFGENTSLRPDRRASFNDRMRDWDLAPPGEMSDDPKNLHAPPPPDFNPSSKHLPNTNSNIGGRVGRHNTGRGQTGQRMDASRSSWTSKSSLRSDRNLRRDDEFFGGQADFDGDGDPDI